MIGPTDKDRKPAILIGAQRKEVRDRAAQRLPTTPRSTWIALLDPPQSSVITTSKDRQPAVSMSGDAHNVIDGATQRRPCGVPASTRRCLPGMPERVIVPLREECEPTFIVATHSEKRTDRAPERGPGTLAPVVIGGFLADVLHGPKLVTGENLEPAILIRADGQGACDRPPERHPSAPGSARGELGYVPHRPIGTAGEERQTPIRFAYTVKVFVDSTAQ